MLFFEITGAQHTAAVPRCLLRRGACQEPEGKISASKRRMATKHKFEIVASWLLLLVMSTIRRRGLQYARNGMVVRPGPSPTAATMFEP